MTLLMVLLTLVVVAGVIAVATGVIRGGLDEPAPTIPARGLPAEDITGRDVASLRFVQGFRGYRMDQVDSALDALAVEVDRLRAQVAQEKSARLQLARDGSMPATGSIAMADAPHPDRSRDDPAAPEPGPATGGLPVPEGSFERPQTPAGSFPASGPSTGSLPLTGPITRPLRRPRRRAESDSAGTGEFRRPEDQG